MIRIAAATAGLALVVSLASPAGAQNRPFQGHAVLVTAADPTDGSSTRAAATDRAIQYHLEAGVPVNLGVIPCGAGSDEVTCINGTYHTTYAGRIAESPGLIEVIHHGLNHGQGDNLNQYSREQQLARLQQGLAIESQPDWNLPGGRPFAYLTVFGSGNTDTVSVLQELGYRLFLKSTGTCAVIGAGEQLNVLCPSVFFTEGGVVGPASVFKTPAQVVAEINAQRDANVLVSLAEYSVRDILNDDGSINESKASQLAAIIGAIANERDNLNYTPVLATQLANRTHCRGQLVTIFGTAAADSISGTVGDDVIKGYAGDDSIQGGEGNDIICGGGANDTIQGQGGNDVLVGNGLNDTLEGGAGDDRLRGKGGDDVLTDTEGANTLNGGPGNDSCSSTGTNTNFECES